MLQINDFSTLFEIAASLNVAFIAVEYATSYTESVAKNVFKFFDKIQFGINHCRKHIDNETIDRLDDVEIDGHSIIPKIEKVKRESEKISKEIDLLDDSLRSSVKEKCQLKCFSMVCLHLFLYCLTASLIGAYEEDYPVIVKIFWVAFSLLSFIYTFLSFGFGEIKEIALCFFQDIKYSVVSYLGIVCISLLSAILLENIVSVGIPFFWTAFVTTTAIYPFVFFLLFIGVLKHHSKNINEDIKTRTETLENKCIELEKEVRKLSSVKELSIEVEGMSAQTGFQQIPPQRQITSGSKKRRK